MSSFAQSSSNALSISISHKGTTHTFDVINGSTVADLKSLENWPSSLNSTKLLLKGKALSESDVITSKKAKVKILAMGMSASEISEFNKKEAEKSLAQPRLRDDISKDGRRELARRKLLGQNLNAKSSSNRGVYKVFGRIETLPMLPERSKSESILRSLASDPGVIECCKRRNWKVGALCEMYPEGKVGVSDVCVMGLNVNKGQKILLRLRTDDLQGWRKMESIRKVLFHELSHNDISEHNGEFFKLMREVEKECNSMNWKTQGGSSVGGSSSVVDDDLSDVMSEVSAPFQGGSGRLGGESAEIANLLDARDMAANAAVMRLTREEEEVCTNCGCGDQGIQDFLRETAVDYSSYRYEVKEDVWYLKSEQEKVEAKILGVHYDDGPDKPYYTIEFGGQEGKVEKQTTGERIRKLEDEGNE
ncbi:hypothetical protein TrVE_jg10825 [Triparma verrucosa]|uniref:WLM domain-containing protein n=1 Tax=Triparma verrucosa TaxID=1606542 RepID=A0A9W7EU64_9STRA|nr:hypothetical protein TrVE_jg10825 [Triparma verrucosa]